MAWLCVDAGTSVIKAVLLDESGTELAVARQSVAVSRPQPNHSEQDMNAVWTAVVRACNEITQQRVPAEGIAITAQGDGAWLVDDRGRAVGPAILWNDGRAQELVEHWWNEGVTEAAFRHSGSVTYPGLANAIVRWLDQHDPARLSRARSLLSCNGWLHLQMTGEIAVDLSDGSNPFFDVSAREYSTRLFKLYGFEEYAPLLPPPSKQTPVAALCRSAAELLGLTPGIPVVMAPYDIVATTIGCGCTSAGDGCIILGTTLCPEVIAADAGRERAPAGTTIALSEPDLYLRAMPTLTGCEALDWAARMLRANDLEELSLMAAVSGTGASGVVCLPYLSPAGERAPFLSPAARATFHRLSLTHTREDLARAVFEGLSFVIRDCLQAASSAALTRVMVCGGGARNEFWCQLIADVCGCEVKRPSASEVGARGALFTALVATGAMGSMADAAHRGGGDGKIFHPASEQTRGYKDLFDDFIRVREAVAPTW